MLNGIVWFLFLIIAFLFEIIGDGLNYGGKLYQSVGYYFEGSYNGNTDSHYDASDRPSQKPSQNANRNTVNDIKCAQRILKANGYYHLGIEGNF